MTCDSTLETGDASEAALHINDGLLCRDREELETRLRVVAERRPRFEGRVAEILRGWDGRFKDKVVDGVLSGAYTLPLAAQVFGVSEHRLRQWIEEHRSAWRRCRRHAASRLG